MNNFFDDSAFDKNLPLVCMDHLRFVPCRVCDSSAEKGRHSSDPKDIQYVLTYQKDDFNKMVNPEAFF